MRVYLDGATAIVQGAVTAGCNFFAGYPITPASGILHSMMRELPPRGGVAIQGEDEIASIGMCIGATLAGARAMTATSGPGLSLCSENLGLATMGEVPLVVVDVQRMGPGTGAATTVAQGDVQFVRWGTSGGYPVIALAPSTTAECYSLTVKAFDLADRYRCPVFLLTDKELVMTKATVDLAALQPVLIPDRATAPSGAPYRYDHPTTVPPMRHFGAGTTVRFTGSTHDEEGYLTKDPATVEALNTHLSVKIEDGRPDIELVTTDFEPGATTLLIGYGVTAGAVRRTVTRAREERQPVSALIVHSLWPIPEAAIQKALVGINRVIVPELNQGQYRREIERIATGVEVIGVNRLDGGLITPDAIAEALA